MLLPALRNAKEKTLSIYCMSRMKQIGLLANMYYDDYNFFASDDIGSGWERKYLNYLTKTLVEILGRIILF